MENLKIFNSVVLCGLILTSGCMSKPFKLTSEPDNAEVYLLVGDDREKKSIGQTPIIKSKKEIEELIDGDLNAGSTLNLVFEKDGYQTKELWVPSSAGGNLGIDIQVSMLEGTSSLQETKVADQIIDRLFLAQNFARTQQFERALVELDQLLKKFPTFSRAFSMKGAILYANSNLKESLESYEKALDLNPELKSALEMSAKIRKQLKLPQRNVAKVK